MAAEPSGFSDDYIRLIESVAVIFATLVGPILAVQIQKLLEIRRALLERKLTVLRTLMTQRFALSSTNVEAFNSVPIEFYGEADILNAWRAYLAHMGVNPASTVAGQWEATRVDLYFALLKKMAEHLKYKFDFVQLKNDFYSPQLHGDVEQDQATIRRGLADVLSGKSAMPMDVRNFPADVELNGLHKAWLKKQLQDHK